MVVGLAAVAGPCLKVFTEVNAMADAMLRVNRKTFTKWLEGQSYVAVPDNGDNPHFSAMLFYQNGELIASASFSARVETLSASYRQQKVTVVAGLEVVYSIKAKATRE